jgi:hypothetical protein
MGIDVELECHGVKDEDALRMAVSRLREWADIWRGNAGYRGGRVYNGPVIHIDLLDRLYAPGYQRGNWPNIRELIVALRPLCTDLYYCGDNGGDRYEVTDEMLAEMDLHWAEHQEWAAEQRAKSS